MNDAARIEPGPDPVECGEEARWAFVTRKRLPAIGGMERLWHELTSRIARRRRIHVVAIAPGQSLAAFLVHAARQLARACERREIALVHLGDPVLAPLALIPRRFGIPVVVTIHGLDVVYPSLIYRTWRWAFLRNFDAYVCISRAARDAAAAARLPRARLHIIEPGVEPLSPSSALREPYRLLYVGRLVQRKGLAWFVRDVMPELARDRANLRLTVVGEGPERAVVEALAHRSGVAPRIDWLGCCDDVQKAELFRRASLCVLPNVAVPGDMEGFGLVALEAAAASCPVVASNLEGLRDALADGRAGTLLTSQDAAAWIREIRGRLDDPEANLRKAAAARDYIVRYRTWDAMVASYEQLFERVVEARRKTSR